MLGKKLNLCRDVKKQALSLACVPFVVSFFQYSAMEIAVALGAEATSSASHLLLLRF